MNTTFTYDVFLSHNANDTPRVRRLAERLKGAGLRVWLDEWVIKPGDDIYLAIERGLEASRTLILCMSPAAFGSNWVILERGTVLFRDSINASRRFIPLLLADCDIPDTLRRYKYVDYREEGSAAFEELLVACQPEAETPPPAKQPKPKKKAEPERKPLQPELLAVLERKLTGPEAWVRGVAVSPDGKWAAYGSDDATVNIWDLETDAYWTMQEGHTDRVRCVTFAPDGERLLSGADDGTIRVWDARTGTQQKSFRGSQGRVFSLCVLADETRLLSCGAADKENIELWDMGRGSRLWGVKGHERAVNSVVATPNAEWAVSASSDHTLKIWNLETGQCVGTLRGHAGRVNSVQITPDGRYAVSGSEDTTLRIWDLEEETCLGMLEGHHGAVD
jgi:hypothetical protein